MTYQEAQQRLEGLFETTFCRKSNSIERTWGTSSSRPWTSISLQTRMVIEGEDNRLKLRTLLTIHLPVSLSASDARHHLAQLTMATATAELVEDIMGSLSWDAEAELLGASA